MRKKLLMIHIYIVLFVMQFFSCNPDNTIWNVVFIFFDIPFSVVFVSTIHEFSHGIAFFCLGFRIKKLRVGMCTLSFMESGKARFSLTDDSPLSGECVVENFKKQSEGKIAMGFMSGGVAALLLGILFTYYIFQMRQVSPLVWSMLIASFANFFLTLVYGKSTDGYYVRKYLFGRKQNE